MNHIRFRIPKSFDSQPDIYMIGYDENRFSSASIAKMQRHQVSRHEWEAADKGFEAKAGKTSLHFSDPNRCIGKKTMLVGFGKLNNLTEASLRKSFTAAFTAAQEDGAKHIYVENILLDDPLYHCGMTARQYGRLLAEVATLVNYEPNHCKTEQGGFKPTPRFEKIDVCSATFQDVDELESGLNEGAIIGAAVNHAKDLVNTPANDLTPKALAEAARELAQSSDGAIKIKTYGPKALKRMKANAILAVSKASPNEPVLIELTYAPENAKPDLVLALVGKSITFDSGGLDIKTQGYMVDMKGDMAGGAAVLAAMKIIASERLPITVKAILPATENMCGSKGYKAGDVITPMDGPTMEIGNTDAEGRVTLADGISFARKQGATHIVDIATLTGAVRQALGSVMAGAFGKEPEAEFTKQVIAAGKAVGEKFWELPACGEYAKGNESKMADQMNTGGSFGAGASTAASFVLAYTGDLPAVHLDIAAMSMKDHLATGFGARTLAELARVMAK